MLNLFQIFQICPEWWSAICKTVCFLDDEDGERDTFLVPFYEQNANERNPKKTDGRAKYLLELEAIRQEKARVKLDDPFVQLRSFSCVLQQYARILENVFSASIYLYITRHPVRMGA